MECISKVLGCVGPVQSAHLGAEHIYMFTLLFATASLVWPSTHRSSRLVQVCFTSSSQVNIRAYLSEINRICTVKRFFISTVIQKFFTISQQHQCWAWESYNMHAHIIHANIRSIQLYSFSLLYHSFESRSVSFHLSDIIHRSLFQWEYNKNWYESV